MKMGKLVLLTSRGKFPVMVLDAICLVELKFCKMGRFVFIFVSMTVL